MNYLEYVYCRICDDFLNFYYLILLNIFVGNIVLYDCVELGSLDIMKMLFKFNVRMEKDAYGMIFLLAVSVVGYFKIVEYLIIR